ncbi:MAG TPA: PFL family protein [Bacteroidetes bacterium]|nr:PFL family protein [Bacteroidota bacterium]HIL58493.1 PFL family protein [Rhodothermales bacterium]
MPLSLPEILETVRMTEADAFDIRTVTLGISLRGCASRDPESTRQNIYDRITQTARHHVEVAREVESLYGVAIANKRCSITPASLVADNFSPADFVALAETLDRAADAIGVDYLAGFSALVEKGTTPGDRALIEALPEALATTNRVCSSVACGSTKAGINADAVLAVAKMIKATARLTAERDSIGCAKFVAFCNAVGDNPFVAGAFHGPSEPGAAINVGISGPGVVLRAIRQLGDTADFGAVTDAIKRTAFKITRAGELIGRRVAEALSERSGQTIPFGVVDISLAPTPAERDSVGDILVAMGLEYAGAPGTTAALAMLNEAVKRGGLMAARHVGGLSGAFMPVSEDQAMIAAAEKGHLTLEKLEAMSAICSVGLDMVAIPGDTPAETIAGILFDEFAIGMVNDKTTAVRILPVHGKGVGEWADYGGLLGRAPIMPVSGLSSAVFARRGGRIPAPIRSLTN